MFAGLQCIAGIIMALRHCLGVCPHLLGEVFNLYAEVSAMQMGF
jgi:hypothetical protein